MANPQNLKPLTPKKAREIGRKGGIASGKAKQERKRLSEFYAEALARTYEIEIEPDIYVEGKKVKAAKKKKLQGQQLVDYVFGKMFERCDMVTAKLLENIGDFTEGKKHLLGSDPNNPLDITINIIGVEPKQE